MDLGVALVGGIVGGTIAALIGGVVTLRAQDREHKARAQESERGRIHERAMAREARIQDRRARAYEAILEHVARLTAWVERTEPFIGPKPDPPDLVPDDELFRLNALTEAYASPEVLEIVRELVRAVADFQWVVPDVRRYRERRTEQLSGVEGKLREARQRFNAANTTLASRMASELRGDEDGGQ